MVLILNPKLTCVFAGKEYFQRTVGEMRSAGAKLDDKMQPLTESQCGSVVKSSDRELQQYEALSLTEIAAGRVGLISSVIGSAL